MNFWKSVFSESDGTGSFSRVASGFVVLCSMSWASYRVMRFGDVSDLTQIGLFTASLVTVLYGLNKAVTKIGKGN